MQIRRHDRVDAFGLQHHPRRHCVNEHLFYFYLGILFCYDCGNGVPHHHPVSLRVTLRHDDQVFLLPALCDVECKTHYSFHAVACEYRDFSRDFPWLGSVAPSSLAGVLAFGVLSDYYPV